MSTGGPNSNLPWCVRCTSPTGSSACFPSTTSRRERYTEDHRRLFERVAEQTGTALHNSLVFERTKEDALTDQLTGLPNRRWLSRYLPQELSRADRPSNEVAVIAIDIDDFKSINDSYGHDVGDQALRAVAEALLGVCRSYDVCARQAGDEFVVVLPDCSREAAADQTRRAAAAPRVPLKSACGPTSVSGLAPAPACPCFRTTVTPARRSSTSPIGGCTGTRRRAPCAAHSPTATESHALSSTPPGTSSTSNTQRRPPPRSEAWVRQTSARSALPPAVRSQFSRRYQG